MPPTALPKFKLQEAPEQRRWYSSGFMTGGVGSVDTANHTLKDASMIRPGVARGHGMWIDKEMCSVVVDMANGAEKTGIHARFGHPAMCEDALGTFLGRWTNLKLNAAGGAVGDLHLSSASAKSPKGDLRAYIEEMAVKEPAHFGASIVFSRDFMEEARFIVKNGGKFIFRVYAPDGSSSRKETQNEDDIPEGAEIYVNSEGFKSPDPDNRENLPHARCAELHAADLVDDPAATDGMFSGATGLSTAAKMTEWLDTHPQVFEALKEPGMIELLARHQDRISTFLSLYQDHLTKKQLGKAESMPAPETQPVAESPDALKVEIGKLQAENAALTVRVTEATAEITRLTGELAGQTERANKAEAANKTLTESGNTLATELKKAGETNAELTKALEEATAKVTAIEAGHRPVSSTPAEHKQTRDGSLMARARQKPD